MEKVNLVWFKRDLRLRDHAPLKEAIENGLPVILVYCFEPELIASPKSDIRHWRFVWQSLADLNSQLKAYDTKIHIFYMDPLMLFQKLSKIYSIQTVFSHQETGIKMTYDRDKRAAVFFKKENILWKEYAHQGVKRGRSDRKNWSKDWYSMMSLPQENPDLSKGVFYTLSNQFISCTNHGKSQVSNQNYMVFIWERIIPIP